MMLNDQQIEAAARKLCELRGVNPDGKFVIKVYVPPEDGQILNHVHKHCFQWEAMVEEIRAYLQVQESVAFVQIEPVPTERLKEVEKWFEKKAPPPLCECLFPATCPRCKPDPTGSRECVWCRCSESRHVGAANMCLGASRGECLCAGFKALS